MSYRIRCHASPSFRVSCVVARISARLRVLSIESVTLMSEGAQQGSRLERRNRSAHPLYAQSPFDAPPEEMPAPFQRPYGPWWLVTLCAGGVPTVSLAVSAWATDLSIVEGKLRFPFFSGNEFFPVGIPVGHVGEFPSAPETAASTVASRSGRRITSVPELIMPYRESGIPQSARWRMSLESPSNAVASGSSDPLMNVRFAGVARSRSSDLQVSVAASKQPEGVTLVWGPAPQQGELRASYRGRQRALVKRTTLGRRAGSPIAFENVSNSGGK